MDIQTLKRQAAAAFRSNRILAASDFFTYPVRFLSQKALCCPAHAIHDQIK
jgi:hypothetical protein